MALQNKEVRDLKVSLLSKNISHAQNLSKDLRDLGIMAHYFDDFHDFWTSSLYKEVNLLIVDNELLESAGVSLIDHPKVKSKELAIIVSCKENSLLRNDLLLEMRTLGFLNESYSDSSHLSLLIQSAYMYEQNNFKMHELTEQRDRLRLRNAELLEGLEKSKQFSDEYLFLQSIVENLDKKKEMGFIGSLDFLFQKLNFVRRYALFSINKSKTQVVSAHSKNEKTCLFSSLWEGDLEEGLTPQIIKRLIEHGDSLLGGNIIALKVWGKSEHPEKLIILSIEDKGSRLFPWRVFEEQLSLRYMQEEKEVEVRAFNSGVVKWTPWELMAYLDEAHFHYGVATKSLVSFDFTEIQKILNKDKHQRFFWERFQNDFEAEMINLLGRDIIIVNESPSRLVVLVEKENLSKSFILMEDLSQFFEYWRYFENPSLILSRKLIPRVSVLSPSTSHFISVDNEENRALMLEENSEEVSETLFNKPKKSFVFEWNETNAH